MMPQETNELLRGLAEETRKLQGTVLQLAQHVRRSRVTAWVLAAAITMTLLLGVMVGYLAVQNRSSLACMRAWANATSARTAALTTLSLSRGDALDQLLRSAGGKDKALIQRDYQNYLLVSNQYKAAVADNPPPSLPAFTCSLF